MDRRVEVLFPLDEYEGLKREAERQGISFGELIREAARRAFLVPSAERRRKAFDFLMSPAPLDVGPWEEAKKLIAPYTDEELEQLP